MPSGLIDTAWRAAEWERALCREIVYLRRKLARAQMTLCVLAELGDVGHLLAVQEATTDPDLSHEPVLPGNLQSRMP